MLGARQWARGWGHQETSMGIHSLVSLRLVFSFPLPFSLFEAEVGHLHLRIWWGRAEEKGLRLASSAKVPGISLQFLPQLEREVCCSGLCSEPGDQTASSSPEISLIGVPVSQSTGIQQEPPSQRTWGLNPSCTTIFCLNLKSLNQESQYLLLKNKNKKSKKQKTEWVANWEILSQ